MIHPVRFGTTYLHLKPPKRRTDEQADLIDSISSGSKSGVSPKRQPAAGEYLVSVSNRALGGFKRLLKDLRIPFEPVSPDTFSQR